jgi:hypothetical protein
VCGKKWEMGYEKIYFSMCIMNLWKICIEKESDSAENCMVTCALEQYTLYSRMIVFI